MIKFLIILFIAVPTYAQLIPKQKTLELNVHNVAVLSSNVSALEVDKDISDIAFKRLVLPQQSTLYIFIFSYGGDVDMGNRLAYFIDHQTNVELVCVFCASMGAAIFELPNHPRYVVEKSRMMLHEMKRLLSAHNATPEVIDDIQKESDAFNAIFVKRTGILKAKFDQLILDKEWYLDADEMLKNHLADEKVKLHCDPLVEHLMKNTCNNLPNNF